MSASFIGSKQVTQLLMSSLGLKFIHFVSKFVRHIIISQLQLYYKSFRGLFVIYCSSHRKKEWFVKKTKALISLRY